LRLYMLSGWSVYMPDLPVMAVFVLFSELDATPLWLTSSSFIIHG
jgi:hypothetical protein